MESNPVTGLLGLLMILQLIVVLAVLLGGLYALYCFSRAASGLDRLASAVESWVALNTKIQAQQGAQNTPLPGQNVISAMPSPATSPPAANADWTRPIELTNMAATSNAVTVQPEIVQTKPPYIPPTTPSFGSGIGPEEGNREVKRD